MQTMSNLLWAAFGVNRSDGHRTAPSARNWQEIDIYVAMHDGTYVYEPRRHALHTVIDEDIRAATGMQDFVGAAPVNLVYVADLARMDAQDRTEQRFYSAIDTGFIAQNVYLFCASEGLATVVRGLVDRKQLAKVLRLRPEQRVIDCAKRWFPSRVSHKGRHVQEHSHSDRRVGDRQKGAARRACAGEGACGQRQRYHRHRA